VIIPGPIRDTGMWADAGIALPRGIRMKPPAAVADAVVDAIGRDRAEIEVASPLLRAGAALAQLAPAFFAAAGRREAARYAIALTEAGRAHR